MKCGRTAIGIRRRFALRRITGCDDEPEMSIETGAAENRLDFMTQRARGDPQWISRRHQLDARRRTWIENVSRLDSRLDARIKDAGLLVDQRANRRGVQRYAVALAQLRESSFIVIAKIIGVVVLARKFDAESREYLLIRPKVQRFGVGEHPVEVKHDGCDHGTPINVSRRSCVHRREWEFAACFPVEDTGSRTWGCSSRTDETRG